MITLSYCEH